MKNLKKYTPEKNNLQTPKSQNHIKISILNQAISGNLSPFPGQDLRTKIRDSPVDRGTTSPVSGAARASSAGGITFQKKASEVSIQRYEEYPHIYK